MDGVDIGTPDIDASLDVGPDVNFTVDESYLTHLEPTSELDLFDGGLSGGDSEPNRPYHTKRPHRKSRAGCRQCKKRKVKCDESRPTCKACRLRKETCVYPSKPVSTVLVTRSRPNSPSSTSYSSSSPQPSYELSTRSVVISEPSFQPPGMNDALDMKLLWFYTTHAYLFFSVQSGRSREVDHVLQVKVVQHAFEVPFLMNCLMAVSSLHLQALNKPIPAHRIAAYCCRAFEGYRNAIENPHPPDFPALLATSLLMTAVSSQMFREADDKQLCIVDWIQVWRGIGLIFDIVTPRVLKESGMAMLFYRPPVNLGRATSYIPNNLLFMISSINPSDPDAEHQQTYYDMLKYLGSLYQEIVEHGFNPILSLRIVTFFTYIPKEFIPLAKEYRPRALVILAYYLCFVKLLRGMWWIDGIGNRELGQIRHILGDEWAHLLRVPQMVLDTEDRIKISRLIINNRNWTPAELDEYEWKQYARIKTDLKLIDNQGSEYSIQEGEWKRVPPAPAETHSDSDPADYLNLYPGLVGSVSDFASNSLELI